ncbi:MAG: hypothetical protein GY866_35095 [Proteobacteria bacterium]|nr:hypothetical protein [Pseudomonadota bacterium]
MSNPATNPFRIRNFVHGIRTAGDPTDIDSKRFPKENPALVVGDGI